MNRSFRLMKAWARRTIRESGGKTSVLRRSCFSDVGSGLPPEYNSNEP